MMCIAYMRGQTGTPEMSNIEDCGSTIAYCMACASASMQTLANRYAGPYPCIPQKLVFMMSQNGKLINRLHAIAGGVTVSFFEWVQNLQNFR